MVIGIFGGSFNPIHTGHAIIAEHTSRFGGVDEVWLMVSPRNPLKPDITLAPESARLAMASIVADECERVKASDFEFSLPLPSYTYRTLCSLREQFPQHEFRLIIGSDNLSIFDKWKDSEKIVKEFGLIVYPRPGYDCPEAKNMSNVVWLKSCPQVLVSSTYIRELLADGQKITFLVPEKVEDYIKKNNLYYR